VYFYDVGQKLGVDRIAKWANAMGLGIKSGIELDHESAGTIPSSAWKQKRYHERWYPAETLSVAIGQGYVATTPLQMAQVAAIVANGGIRYRPQIIKAVEGLDGSITKAYPPKVETRIAIDPAALATVKDAMADVVNGAGGTAHKAKLDDVIVCGKTGTAQAVGANVAPVGESEAENDKTPEQYKDHAWFIAFAPKEHAKIAAACIIEHGGHGGSASAPVIHDVFQRYFQLHPEAPKPEIARVLEDSPQSQ